MAITPVQQKKFFDALEAGFGKAQSARAAGISEATAYRLINKMEKQPSTLKPMREGTTKDYKQALAEMKLEGPKPYERLSADAKRALVDFDFFRERYFGHVPTPWQKEAAVELVRLLETEQKEYVVLNCPPGVGKTTMIHDIICWMIVRNRKVRILIGSATMQQAKKSLNRIRRSLERVTPVTVDDNLKQRGLAVDAEGVLAVDFGRFKPLDREQWTNEAFIVMQEEFGGAISEKESTVQAYGMDATYLGDRVDAAIWDDLVDPKTTKSVELREQLEERWGDVAESRLEPSGLMALVGQRLAGDDLYRYCLDMLQPLDLEDEDMMDEMSEEEIASLRRDKKYQHIKFQAHYEEKCSENTHKPASKPYPEGCLLDPRRLPWREIKGIMSNRANRFQVVYQQEDTAVDDVFVQNYWIYGYGGHPGCVDKDRDQWQMPAGINPADCIAIATADPSPTNYWAIEMWVYHPASNQRFLLDLIRAKMEAPDFLDFNLNEQRFTGVMEEWQKTSETIGFPIQYWIVERNAAQRFMLQYDMVKKGMALRGVEIMPHDTTGRNKADESLGVTSIREHYQYGRVRLMGKGEGKVRSMRLIDEVTKYGHDRTDDCVMAHWFFEWNLPRLSQPTVTLAPAWRPSWAKNVKKTLVRI